MSIAIIPARGGSKRIPRKNIKDFCGKPMIAYAICAAKKSGLFKHIIVSTEDSEIAQIAKKFGADVPFLRPIELSNDSTPTVPVIKHAIEACQTLGLRFSKVCCIYPCAPFIEINDLKRSLILLDKNKVNYCFPVAEYPFSPLRALKFTSDGLLTPFYSKNELLRSQDLEKAYVDAGQFYWGNIQTWLANDKIHSNSIGYEIPNWRVVDIDNLSDWKRAEIMYSFLSKNKN